MGTSRGKSSRSSGQGDRPLRRHSAGKPSLAAPVQPATRLGPSGMDPEKRRQLMQSFQDAHQGHTSRVIGDDGRIYYRGQVVGHAPRPIPEAQDPATATPTLSPPTSPPASYPQAQLSSPPLSYPPRTPTYQMSPAYGFSGSSFLQQTQCHPDSAAPGTPQYPPGYSPYRGATQYMPSYPIDAAYTD
jgi:hypothetical protein